MKQRFFRSALLLAFVLSTDFITAQITLPPSGGNQRSEVSQWMGLVKATFTWNSVDVHDPNGTDRRGHIWGELVPYGLNNEGFGGSSKDNPTPWRAGSNENTIVQFSHDVRINGQPLPAGRYGFFILVEKDPADWTLIFSKNATSWGAYFYKKEEDALRVTAKPQTHPYSEWLTYEFDDRELGSCTARLRWEDKAVAFKIESAQDPKQLYLAGIRDQLRGATGFSWEPWQQAADWCVTNKTGNLEEALAWAEKSVSGVFVGKKNFATLSTKANVLRAMGRTADAQKIMQEAIADPSATALDIHMYARALQGNGKKQEAFDVFKLNAEKHPNEWVSNAGMGRGYSMMGDYKKATQYVKEALRLNPPEPNKQLLEKAVETLTQGKDFN